ncbi:MAG: ABC transporter permease [Saprospiraceae bacterium]|nr:ABC transporter permease [Saprospiraceae bacterium]MCF8250258.1 ABC transporter permease [Saprospiraceae bacterium]MCF8280914.1 ABC transporter permease [Bacteroidales bacterium]MCF8312110.1 ABC transporter permease [Saprospiraceae bacterium]MCF8440517.1 ABC transporter permease [Saprospiraceae bacterium]
MDKLWLIIQREYLTRVKKKSFIIITLLSPIIFVALFTIPVLVGLFAGKETKSLVVKDDSGVFVPPIDTSARATFTMSQEPLASLKATYKSTGFDGVLYIPALEPNGEKLKLSYFSEGQLSLSTVSYVENRVAEQLETKKIKEAGYSEAVIKNFKTAISIDQEELAFNEEGQLVETGKKNSAELATAIGFVSGFIIYIVLIFYGAMIMRSVMEEKTNRIVEVIISSVKPFQLMMGKILGVSAVGLTQMLIWMVMTFALSSMATAFLGMDTASMQTSMPVQQPDSAEMASQASMVFEALASQNWGYILPLFLFYFVGGYFIYASLFAAVGASMGDDMGESQSLSMVAMAPIILSIILISPVIENPTSALARWMSIFPLFSPVLMPARLAFEPPWWEVILSMVVLAGSAVFFVWLSGRIYRVGVLLYGKKATLKEMVKWTFSSE